MRPRPPFGRLDRYKASSYRAYNYKLPARYDSMLAVRLFRLSLWDQAVVEEIGPEIRSLAILDVGCATGRLLAALARAGSVRLAGVDLAPKILEVAEAKLAMLNARVDLRPADVESGLPWPAESFDLVTLTGVLHHLYRPGDALREIRRVLRPDGRLLLIDPGFFTPVRQLFNLYLRLVPHDGDYRFYTRAGAIALLADAGFRCVRERSLWPWSHLLTAARSGTGQAAG
jgi:ubiquinone/menaquinone biosynthesis C-methylase UbiE